jgi:hypothetical protein
MAFTERYVTVAGAGAHDGTSEANAWTFAEMIAAAPGAHFRINIKAGSYSSGAATLPSGAANAPNIFRGYNSTIGDLDGSGRADNQELDVTNFPVLTLTGLLVLGIGNVLQNLSITGSVSGLLLGGNVNDGWTLLCCKLVNSASHANARVIQADNSCAVICCDLECSGTTRSTLVDADSSFVMVNCRLKAGGTDTDPLVVGDGGYFVGNLFLGTGVEIGLSMQATAGTTLILGNTFYNLAESVAMATGSSAERALLLLSNVFTDSGSLVNSAYTTSPVNTALLLHNRYRDITTPFSNVEVLEFGNDTTDTGGASTDYTDAGSGDFTLIDASPAKGMGLLAYSDAGAYQREEPAPGGGGGQTSHCFIG